MEGPIVVMVLSLLMLIGSMPSVESTWLEPNYYASSCPGAETTISEILGAAVRKDKRVAAAMTRLVFHDCFVQGCDASVLIQGSGTEITSVPNQTLHSLDVVDKIKAALEAMCPNTVSCADIIAYAAAFSIRMVGGTALDPLGGRLDGLVSTVSDANNGIPSPFSSLATLQGMFGALGLDDTDLVALSGAHSIGKSHCSGFAPRLWNFNSTVQTDPSLDPKLAESLKKVCPQTNASPNAIVNMDPTPKVQDNKYFQGVVASKGLFISDAALITGSTTSLTQEYASNANAFWTQFAISLKKMSSVGIKTGSSGNIRKTCSVFN